MALKDIYTISGQPGLFRFVSNARNGIIVECLQTKKRVHAFATYKISTLEDIAVYTDSTEVPLADVLNNVRKKENGNKAIDPKTSSPEVLKAYMEEVLPNYDKEKVYVSDIKKMISWYNILQETGMPDLEKKEEAEDITEAKEETEKTEEIKEEAEEKKE